LEGDVDLSDILGAQAKLVVFIASLLARAGVSQQLEFAALLETFAASIAETQPGEGALLTNWAQGVRSTQGH